MLPAPSPGAPLETPRIPFVDVTESAGIRFVHESGASSERLLPEAMGSGCAFFDYDGDGDPDVLFVNSRRWPWDTRPSKPATLALYRNDGRGAFEDVTAGSGLDVSLCGMGVACGDYDNDGRVDVFVSALGANRLFHNVGGRFEDATETAGVGGDESAWNTSCGWFDADGDGDLDLFVCHYVAWTREKDVSRQVAAEGGARPYAHARDFDGGLATLYRNEGGGKFTDVSAEAGVRIKDSLTDRSIGRSLGLTFADVDDDGAPDVLIANDSEQNFFLRNRKDGRFEDLANAANFAFDLGGKERRGRGIDVCRFRDGDARAILIGTSENERTALFVDRAREALFTDETAPSGLGFTTKRSTFGILFCDLDLDGRPEVVAANGGLDPDVGREGAAAASAEPPQLFWNGGADQVTEFIPMAAEKCGEDFLKPITGRGLACADVDGDGDLDLLMTSCGGRPRLLRNDQAQKSHWVRVKLKGTKSNRDAIGARVEVVRGDGLVQRAQVMPTRSYLSQSELIVTFGLGASDSISSLRVLWPSGKVTQRGPDFQVDKLTVIEEPPED